MSLKGTQNGFQKVCKGSQPTNKFYVNLLICFVNVQSIIEKLFW